MKLIWGVLLSTILICSCSHISVPDPNKPEGDTASLTLEDNSSHGIELLAITDSELYARMNGTIYLVNLTSIQQLHISAYSKNAWAGVGKFLLAIPTVGLEILVGNAGSETKHPEWTVLAIVAVVATISAIGSGEPKVTFKFPANQRDLADIRLYCRYPQGLNQEQWRVLLDHYGQDDFQTLEKLR